MGKLTVAEILSEGGLLAGDTSKAARAKVDFLAWLRSQYASFLWPFLQAWTPPINLNAGATGISVGDGASGVNYHILRILDPIYIYPTDYTWKAPIRVITATGDNDAAFPDSFLANKPTGCPTVCRVRSLGPGKRAIDFNVAADKPYKLKIGAHFLPDDPADSDVPLYPNDHTMIQAVAVFILKYMKADNYPTELEVLVNKVNDDRLKYGVETGINDQILLDPKVFR